LYINYENKISPIISGVCSFPQKGDIHHYIKQVCHITNLEKQASFKDRPIFVQPDLCVWCLLLVWMKKETEEKQKEK